jgi:hypothetical protein
VDAVVVVTISVLQMPAARQCKKNDLQRCSRGFSVIPHRPKGKEIEKVGVLRHEDG